MTVAVRPDKDHGTAVIEQERDPLSLDCAACHLPAGITLIRAGHRLVFHGNQYRANLKESTSVETLGFETKNPNRVNPGT